MRKIDYAPKVKVEKIKRFGKGPTPSGTAPWTTVDTSASVRATQFVRSVSTPGGSTALKPSSHYSGDKMIGISQMAKSNAVPVFDFDHITDIARMRR